MIGNIKAGIMGTIRFEGKFKGMRKAQEFSVYPINESTKQIMIQSDTRIGYFNSDTGIIELTKPRSGGAHAPQLAMQRNSLIETQLSDTDKNTLISAIHGTSGDNVGNNAICMTCDNSKAHLL